jgi:hypothetical protein
LLTDDLLVLRREGKELRAHPGPARVKLFPEVTTLLLGEAAGTPMNDRTSKLIVRLPPGRFQRSWAPLSALYVLLPSRTPLGRGGIEIHALSKRRAFVELTKNTFNPLVTDRDRLRGQFATAADVSKRVPIRGLSFTRSLGSLPSVRDAILADLSSRSA